MTPMNELSYNTFYYTSLLSMGTFLIYKFCHHYFPKKTNKNILTLGFALINMFNNGRSWLNTKMYNISSIFAKKIPKISFILEGKEIAAYSSIDEITYTNKSINNYDLILYNCNKT